MEADYLDAVRTTDAAVCEGVTSGRSFESRRRTAAR
jgi:hypothetical protein